LAGVVIASHYAEPLARTLAHSAVLRSAPDDDSDAVMELAAGEDFALLDDSLGWAWGYGGGERRVGYIRSAALSA
jgi:hypothetical protein